MKYCNVIIPVKYIGLDRLYTYSYHGISLTPGMRIKVPFGKRQVIGIVFEILKEKPSLDYKIRQVIDIMEEEPFVPYETLEVVKIMMEKYYTGPYHTLYPFLFPGNLEDIIPKKIDSQDKIFYLDKKEREKYYFHKEKMDVIKGKAQEKVINVLKEYGPLTYLDIQNLGEVSRSPIDTLKKKGVLYTSYLPNMEKKEGCKPLILTDEQKKAFTDILENKDPIHLLHGLTGSGKTEIYLQLAKKTVEEGGNVLFLVPEISLTPQMIQKLESRFPGNISVLHSKLSNTERRREWLKIFNNEVSIAIGVRSAIFAPFESLDLIIIDEEQESSYSFHNALRYDSREVAKWRGEKLKAKIVLGSATPSIETYYKANKGEIRLHRLTKRPFSGKLPETTLVDMREELGKGNISIFSEKLYEEMEFALKRREQIILFLNRRGYANFVSCRSCGHVVNCDYCDISMNYHKTIHRLRCHYCGSTKKLPQKCPECGSSFIKTFGIGTQQVEEEIKGLFPTAKIFRMDRDTTYEKNSYDEVYHRMQNQEIDILIGTQMLAKGLDFPNVTLVGILAADLSLYVSDFRAQEKTFQLISQVSGRAGRGSRPGLVVLQTYNPENYSLQYACGEQYLAFYQKELEERKQFFYPPFSTMVDISVTGDDPKAVYKYCEDFYNDLVEAYGKTNLLGTKIIETPKIKNRYTYHFQCKVDLEDENLLRLSLQRVLNKYDKLESSKNFIDIMFY
ncbi:MAG: primosomal protein N' [Tissierellia bacterium]|nr:primosomal protein N' [Tissierellia bacterium]